jgi:hypothetical protein
VLFPLVSMIAMVMAIEHQGLLPGLTGKAVAALRPQAEQAGCRTAPDFLRVLRLYVHAPRDLAGELRRGVATLEEGAGGGGELPPRLLEQCRAVARHLDDLAAQEPAGEPLAAQGAEAPSGAFRMHPPQSQDCAHTMHN